MNFKRSLWFAFVAALSSCQLASAATLTEGATVQVSTNNANFDLSIFPGATAYNDRGIGGTEPGSPNFTNLFGDGTVLDYNFFHSPAETIASYAKGPAGLIDDATCPPGNINGAGENWSNVWVSTDPVDFTTTKDFSNGAIPNTFARAANVTGTIDISGLTSGQLFFPHGTFINSWTLTVTMTGPGQPNLTANANEADGPGVNKGWITDFTFADSADYDEITYTYVNTDTDGSRARFMGVILVGAVAPATPPTLANLPATNLNPSSATLEGEVTDTGGASPSVTIYWGDNDAGTTTGNWDNSVSLGSQAGPFSTNLSGLSPSTTFYFRSFAQNAGGSTWAPSTATFTTDAFSLPELNTAPAANVTGTAAKIGGSVTSTGGDPPNVTLFWGTSDGGSSALNWDHQIDLEEQGGDFMSTLTGLSPLTTYYFRAFVENDAGPVWGDTTESFVTLEVSELLINEFMASNDRGESNNSNNWYPISNQIAGTSDDWIEILNTGATTLDLGGWYLTDDPSDPTKWVFPSPTNLPSGGFLIVYASGSGIPDVNGNLHTNFKLSSGGENLALVRPLGTVASEFSAGGSNYQSQDEDISFGLHPITGVPVYFSAPTPGSANDSKEIARVGDTSFSPDRGYYQQAIEVTIASSTPDAAIYYTTDGTRPIDTNGNPTAGASLYSVPIAITQTTALKAAATKTGFTPTNIDCQTYILLDIDNANPDGTDAAGLNTSFLQQTQPAGWGNLSSGDYNMDTRVSKSTATATGHSETTAQTMLKGLRDIPTISIAMNRSDFSGGSGIYTNSGNGALEYECSAEYIPSFDDTRDDWQVNCGIKVQGGASRNPSASPKHSMNFRFRGEYGPGKLRQPLFPGSAVEEFNSITLRAGYNNSWIHRDAGQRGRGSMIRDQWMRESMLDMGNPAAGHGFMVHVFVNGLYWGVHNLCERPEASHYAAYNGGDEDLIDARNANSVVDGTATAWNAIPGVVASGDWNKIQQVIDINQYIDYQIVNRYGGNADLKSGNNWRAAGGGPFPAGQPGEMAPYQLYSWDGERTMEGQTSSISPVDPMGVRSALEGVPEYRVRFADRLQMHFSKGGALTPEATSARWMKFANDLDRAIIAESARWGDHRGTLYTRDSQWLAEQSRLITQYFPVRSDNVLNNYRPLFPSTEAPQFVVNGAAQAEGVIPIGETLQIIANSGTIYYTTDGSDPRLEGGGINPTAGNIGAGSKKTPFIELEASGWNYLDTGVAQSDSEVIFGHPSYNSSDWKHPSFNDTGWQTGQALLGYGFITGRSINTLLNLQTPRLPTIYLRKPFNVTDVNSFTQISASLIRDDGAIVYLNGKELGRSNMPGGNQQYGDFASNATSDEGGLVNLGTFDLSPGDLREGSNILAVELHQSSSTSSDTGIDVELSGVAPIDGGSSTVPLTGGTLVRARAFENNEWSPITEGEFLVAPIADSSNIVISEMMYNPTGTSEDSEWIELLNTSAATIDLSNLSLTGIDYTFPLGFTLPPDTRVVVVKNQTTFAAIYNTTGINIAPGEFSTSSLSNSGEQIALIDALGVDARRFTYNDKAPWPTSPDGEGYSIVLICPDTNPDHTYPSNWRSSSATGGTPGGSDFTTFTGDPNLDEDNDGLSSLLEYALGSIHGDTGSSPESHPTVGTGTFENGAGFNENYPTITYRRNLSADDIIYEVEVSSDLESWSPLETSIVSSIANGDGTETVTYRSNSTQNDFAREFLRLKASLKQ